MPHASGCAILFFWLLASLSAHLASTSDADTEIVPRNASTRPEFSKIYLDLLSDILIQDDAEGRLNISLQVDIFFKRFREDLIKYNKTGMPFPLLMAAFADSTYQFEIDVEGGTATGGETIERDGTATLYIEQGSRDIIIDIPFRLMDVKFHFDIVFRLLGLGTDCTISGQTSRPATYFMSFRITPWGVFSVRDIRLVDRSFAMLNVIGAGPLINWCLAVVWIMCALSILAIVESAYLIYCCVVKRRRRNANKDTSHTGNQ